tara:strand:- start:1430 stop:1840 length:411 start_codon:yes stop_codon:yes gene_type:complete
MSALVKFRQLSKRHANVGLQVMGVCITIMALTNIMSAFSMQCVENESARSMNKINLLIGGAAMAFGGILFYAARSNLLTEETIALGVASLFLLAQAIVSLIGQSGDKDCQKGILSNLGNIGSVVLALLGVTSVLVK